METKPGIYTTELWLGIFANLLVNIGAIDVGAKYRGILAVATVVGYTLSRGLAKQGVPATDPVPPVILRDNDDSVHAG